MTNTLSMPDLDINMATDSGLIAENDTAHRELAEFRVKVREAVLKQHSREGGWCLPGSNDVLNDLGLPPIQYAYAGSVTVTVEVYIPEAADRFAAANLVAHHLTVQSGDAMVEVRDFALQDYAEDELTDRSAH